MNASYPTEEELSDAIEAAAEAAIKELFAEHPGQYYYVSLITTGAAHPPVLAAWSEEALESAVKMGGDPWELKRRFPRREIR